MLGTGLGMLISAALTKSFATNMALIPPGCFADDRTNMVQSAVERQDDDVLACVAFPPIQAKNPLSCNPIRKGLDFFLLRVCNSISSGDEQ